MEIAGLLIRKMPRDPGMMIQHACNPSRREAQGRELLNLGNLASPGVKIKKQNKTIHIFLLRFWHNSVVEYPWIQPQVS